MIFTFNCIHLNHWTNVEYAKEINIILGIGISNNINIFVAYIFKLSKDFIIYQM